jgi:hypothetical protein
MPMLLLLLSQSGHASMAFNDALRLERRRNKHIGYVTLIKMQILLKRLYCFPNSHMSHTINI